MKNIIIVALTVTISVLGIFVTINYIEEKYQSAIAVAIATASIQLVLFFLKQEFDKDSHKKSKSFGVIYDRKFIVYNEIYHQIFEAKGELIPFLRGMVKHQQNIEITYNSIYKLKQLTLGNRLLMTDDLYNLLDKLNTRYYIAFKNCDYLQDALKNNDNEKIYSLGLQHEIDYDYFTKEEPFKTDFVEIEKHMKKELHIN